MLGARRQDRIRSLAPKLTGAGRKAIAVTTDVTESAQVRKLVDAAAQTYGRIDVMINNAGLMPQAPLERFKIDEWDRMIDVNLKGVLYGIAAPMPYMQRQKFGHFINVSSVAGHKVGPGFAVYAATKFAVRALSEGLRQEVKPDNIRTAVISPGAVATELPDTITDPDTAAPVRGFYAAAAIPADSFARAVAFAVGQPKDVDINEILFRPTRQDRSADFPQMLIHRLDVDLQHDDRGPGAPLRADTWTPHVVQTAGLRRRLRCVGLDRTILCRHVLRLLQDPGARLVRSWRSDGRERGDDRV